MKKIIGNRAGFTMIELLVVIAVIGVLAVAVLTSINPVEQINKGRDTRARADASQLQTSLERYFAANEMYPWNDERYVTPANSTNFTAGIPEGAVGTTNVPSAVCADDATYGALCLIDSGADVALWIDALTTTAEVKQTFIDRIISSGDDTAAGGSGGLFVYKAESTGVVNEELFVCFLPTSSSFRDVALGRCLTEDTSLPPDACPQTALPYDAGTTTWDGEMICLP